MYKDTFNFVSRSQRINKSSSLKIIANRSLTTLKTEHTRSYPVIVSYSLVSIHFIALVFFSSIILFSRILNILDSSFCNQIFNTDTLVHPTSLYTVSFNYLRALEFKITHSFAQLSFLTYHCALYSHNIPKLVFDTDLYDK